MWREIHPLMKAFSKEHGGSAFARQQESKLQNIQYHVDFNLNPHVRKVLQALKNPSKHTDLIQRVAAGFMIFSCDNYFKPRYLKEFPAGPGVRTHPVDRETPAVIKSVVHIPENRQTNLKLKVSS